MQVRFKFSFVFIVLSFFIFDVKACTYYYQPEDRTAFDEVLGFNERSVSPDSGDRLKNILVFELLELLTKYIAADKNINLPIFSENNTILLEAIKQKKTKIVLHLLSEDLVDDVCLSYKNAYGENALLMSIKYQNLDVFNALLNFESYELFGFYSDDYPLDFQKELELLFKAVLKIQDQDFKNIVEFNLKQKFGIKYTIMVIDSPVNG